MAPEYTLFKYLNYGPLFCRWLTMVFYWLYIRTIASTLDFQEGNLFYLVPRFLYCPHLLQRLSCYFPPPWSPNPNRAIV